MARWPRLLILLLAVVLLAAAGYNLAFNPMAQRRAALQTNLESAPADSQSAATATGQAERRKWQTAVQQKRNLWQPLVETAAAPRANTSIDQLVANITVMPGRIGGANPRVRLATPEYPQGQFFRKGDQVRPQVILQDITPDAIVLQVNGTQLHRLPL